MPSKPRFSRKHSQSPPPRRRQYSPAPESEERRRRGSGDNSERGYRRRGHDDDADSQFSDQDGHDSTPPNPEREVDNELDVDAEKRYRPMAPFSWRNEMCRLLEVSPDALDEEVFQAIGKASKILKETEKMRALFEARQGPPRYQVIHAVRCEKSRTEGKLYLDQPWVVETGPQNAHLRGSQPILNFELFLERNKEVVAIIYKNYRCCEYLLAYQKKARHEGDGQIEASSLLTSEEIAIISEDLKSAMVEFSDSVLRGFPHPEFEEDEGMKYPYIWWFHRRKEINGALERYKSSDWFPMVNLVREYILERMTEEWETVDNLLGRKKISLQYMGYLFLIFARQVPQQIAISTNQGRAISKLEGVVTDDWLNQRQSIDNPAIVDVTFWTFDGMFHKNSKEFAITDLSRDVKSETEEFDITDLPLYPIEYASSEVVEALRQRGRMFWKCRFRNYVSLAGEMSEDTQDSIGSRFMVDIVTHRKLHRDGSSSSQRAPFPVTDVLDAKYMSEDNPDLTDDFFMCLPTSIFGFNMDKKEWVNLDVHYLRDVVWNTEAFDLLVVQEETKVLIQAVVTNQLRTAENADLIQGKGNGLFILLHGGPGTGKTLTAESVAEVAEKPLYRVTCGDIGTKAEDVEQYLNVVLHLGKTWGCVVLLDEADIFLEQRSLVNLERNALVSVFLRVLEYYDGILILTSNRVGIFDEAFKSRIQLNLRYKNLDRGQRLQIWKNFFVRINRLEQETLEKDQTGISYGVNVNEMTAKLDELADANLNGRQIRNAISTARQLSRYLKEPLGYKHLTAVISEAKKFDEYLLELNRTYTADELQRDKGERKISAARPITSAFQAPGIEYSESLKDGENHYSPTYIEIHEKALKERIRLARLREEMNAKAAAIPSPPRSGEYDGPVTDFRTMPVISSSPDSSSSDSNDDKQNFNNPGQKMSNVQLEAILKNKRTYERNSNKAGPDQKYVGEPDRLGHKIASKLRRQGPGALINVRNKDTISKDNTIGNQAQMDEQLASFGKNARRMQYRELRKISDPDLRRDLPGTQVCY
ncbi:hypothetical protein FAVG1_02329 [Fusarium avenaceum]|nr:hypothetical protein FAVG1_02329 [Fusarium avenaceum]